MNTLTYERFAGAKLSSAAAPVIQQERIGFITVKYRGDFILFHGNMLTHLKRITDCYPIRGWDHYRLCNGGTYMAPTYARPTPIIIDGRDTGIALSGDALGICICMITLSKMAANEEFGWMKEMLNKLYDFIWEHPEKTGIQKAVIAYLVRYPLGQPV